jgi:TrmH family RNA methyltransferase
MGSVSRVSVAYRELEEFLEEAARWPNFTIYGCFLEGENLYQASLEDRGLIVMGSESHGIAQKLLPHINRRLYIPSFQALGGTGAESLNVSVATGIVCSEFRRRQK